MLVAKLHTSKSWLYKKYVTDKLKEDQIAKLANVDQSTINRWLVKYELKKKR